MKKLKFIWAAIAVFMAVLMLLSACTRKEQQKPPESDNVTNQAETQQQPKEESTPPVRPDEDRFGGDLVIATASVANTLDPHYSAGATANYQWMQNVFETAIIMGADGQYYPMICDFDYADDGLSLKLTVRDYFFSNGEKVTVDDVVASFERAGSVGGSFATKVTDNIIDTKIDGNSVTFTFSQMNVTMLQEISDLRGPGYIMPKSVIDKIGTDNQITDTTDIIGTGCYTLKVYKPDVEIVLLRNEKYVAADFGGNGPASAHNAYVDTITYSVNTDAASRTAGMIAGDYSIGGILTEMQPYADKIGLKKRLMENQWTHAVFFNLSEENKNSPIQDVNLRKAIRAAIDIDAVMLSVMSGDASRYILDPSPITPYNKTYYNDIIKNADYNVHDLTLAKQYLDASTYNGQEITWLVSEGGAFYKAAVVAIPALEEIGIKVNLRVVDGGSHGDLRSDPASGFDIGAWETQKAISNPVEQSSLITGTAAGWWKNEKKNAFLEMMRTSQTGSAQSIKAYEDMCGLITEEVPYVVFGTGLTLNYTQPDVEMNFEGTNSYYWNSYFTK